MPAITFLVQGSAPEPYQVLFEKLETNISARCTCPAGRSNTQCKHRVRILRGNSDGIVSGNENQVSEVSSWLTGSDVETALNELDLAEVEFEKAKLLLSEAKKKVAKALCS